MSGKWGEKRTYDVGKGGRRRGSDKYWVKRADQKGQVNTGKGEQTKRGNKTQRKRKQIKRVR